MTNIVDNPRSKRMVNPWSLGAAVIAAVILLPIVSVLYLALFPENNIWPHLVSTTLPRYLSNTIVLMTMVGVLTAMIGTGAAWIVVMYRFPGRRWLQWALLMPLAVPAYVSAYALVDFLEYAGPVQTGLRAVFGWADGRDYWFPQIRSIWSAGIILGLSLYPYVYIIVRAALREQSGAGYEVARALGAGPFARLFRIGLPLVRPAIAAGTAVAMMETVNDFGTVDYFAVQTLTTGVFSVWQQSGNVGGAAQISVMILSMIILLVAAERMSRRKGRFHGSGRGQRPVTGTKLKGYQGIIAFFLCVLPFVLGFLMPVLVIGSHALGSDQWVARGLDRALFNTMASSGAAALICVVAALFMTYGVRLSGRRLPQRLLPVTTIGYAAPGAVLGLGLLIPLAAADNAFADFILAVTGYDPGLIVTGSAAAVVLAYCVRFFALAQGASDAALARVSPSLPMAARSLGRDASGVLRDVHVPLIRATIGSAMLLVFVDAVKELPATLLLRPFGFNTLATRVYEKASLENLADAAPAALMICAVGLVAVALLARANR